MKRNNSLREKYEKRKKERQDILNFSPLETDPLLEKTLITVLQLPTTVLPTNTQQLKTSINNILNKTISASALNNLIKKLALHKIIQCKEISISSVPGLKNIEKVEKDASIPEQNHHVSISNEIGYEIHFLDHELLKNFYCELLSEMDPTDIKSSILKEESNILQLVNDSVSSLNDTSDIMSLLSLPSTKEKQSKQVGEEILELLSKPTAKERSLVEKFKSQGGTQVMEFCPHGTKSECMKMNLEESNSAEEKKDCKRLHFKKIIQGHTDESLGDCSFLNTCFHMDSCKYVHYEVDANSFSEQSQTVSKNVPESDCKLTVPKRTTVEVTLYPPQWIQCDLRYLDMTILGKFAVIMADPPWDIHMELPYGTMSDDEMRQLGVPALQDDGLIFLWVTGRAMELGRECLKLWGYERVDELIWVKTNQLQRIIRTGRTGHWLNHGKEHCLVGMKGSPVNLNRGLDCDVIVAEVRATSHKPDEIYGIIERLSPGTRKIELFGRPHNIQPNWLTLGNQLDGIRLVDPELIKNSEKIMKCCGLRGTQNANTLSRPFK